jgi:hypothetical protein
MPIEEKLLRIFGNRNIADDPGILDIYSKNMGLAQPIKPRCVVKPENVFEVQETGMWKN